MPNFKLDPSYLEGFLNFNYFILFGDFKGFLNCDSFFEFEGARRTSFHVFIPAGVSLWTKPVIGNQTVHPRINRMRMKSFVRPTIDVKISSFAGSTRAVRL